jgi:hypothetical protein
MLSPLSYDRDLRIARRWALGLGLFNLAIMAIHVYEHNWTVAVAAFGWAVCCWVWRRIIAGQQTTRDELRIFEAIRREIEPEEF